jgi:hypothetical protein
MQNTEGKTRKAQHRMEKTGGSKHKPGRQYKSVGDVEQKLAAVRAAAELNCAPSPDIDVMLAEIEQGYQSDKSMSALEKIIDSDF